jgi:hypothetical protein
MPNLPPVTSCPETPDLSPTLPGINSVRGIEKMLDDEEVTIPKEVASTFQTTREYLQRFSGKFIHLNECPCLQWLGSDILL